MSNSTGLASSAASTTSSIPNSEDFRLPRFDFERSSRCSSVYYEGSISEKALIRFNKGDIDGTEHWSTARRLFAVGTSMLILLNAAIASSLPSGSIAFTADYFRVTDQQQLALPVSVFLIGYVFGPLLYSPLSETYGRRLALLTSFVGYTAFTLGCALAPTWPALLVFRFFVGLCASAPYTLVGGVCADVYANAAYRGRAIMVMMIVLNVGPASGPIISGFVSPINWRLNYWVALILAAVSWLPVLFFPETYGPVIQARNVRHQGKHYEDQFSSLSDGSEKQSLKKTLSLAFVRPFRMFAEPIVSAIALFMAVLYAIYYLFFEAYPIVFGGVYKMRPGIAALAFIPMAIGSCMDIPIVIWWDNYLERAKMRDAPWTRTEEYRRLPLACLGGPLCVLSLFWLGWSARSDVHWIVPMLGGVPYGMGVEIIFMALTSYLSDGYGTLTASALAAGTISRSVCGALLPLLAQPMYQALGVNWASSALGFVTLFLAGVPFLLLRYGPVLRKRSALCQQVKEQMQQGDVES